MTASSTRRTAERSAKRPKVFLIHRYFAPDTPPYANILRGIALALCDGGFDVEVLTCQPSYNQAVAGTAPAHEQIGSHVTVTRWPVLPDRKSSVVKIANLVVFGARIVGRLALSPRVDAVMAASTPPVAIAMLASLMAKIRRAPFVYHNQDIYPEVAEVVGRVPRRAVGLLKRFDTATDRRSARVVVLSEDMARTIVRRGVDRSSVTVINNFDPWTLPDRGGDDVYDHSCHGAIRFVYAGNLGRFQNLEAVARIVADLGDDDRFSFDFIGDGALRPWLQQYIADHELRNVRVHGYLSPETLAAKLQTTFDVGIVSLHPGVIHFAYPSKVMSYIRNGLPVLALIEPNTDLVDDLTRYKAGWAVDPMDHAAVKQTLESLWEDRDRLAIMRDEARRMYESEFAEAGQLSNWVSLFDDILLREA